MATTRRREPILARTQTKRQHYVPRFLLERFIVGSQIERIELASGSTIITSAANAAVECGFYDVEVGGEKLSAEMWLADSVEGPVVPVIRNLADDPASLLATNKLDQWLLARFIVAQRFRVPAFRNFVEDKRQEVEEKIADLIGGALGRTVSRDELPDLVQGIDPPAVSHGADASLSMLGEVDGFANLLLVKRWRIGRVLGKRRLYTSDNAVASYLPSVRPWWSGGAFWEHQYYFPVSPDVLLWIAGEEYASETKASELPPFGPRDHRDFTEWEASFARHVVSDSAEEYLFGSGPHVDQRAAREYLARFDQMQVEMAMQYQGYDPRQPRNPAVEAILAKRTSA